MVGNVIDTTRLKIKKKFRVYPADLDIEIKLIDTSLGKIRLFDTGGNRPVIINAPDGPNVIEHHHHLIKELSKNFRVICFEFPGTGFSFPAFKYNYSLQMASQLIIELMDILKIEKAILSFSCSNGFYAIKAAEINPERFNHIFLSQTPSLNAMSLWKEKAIPKILTIPVIGQIANSFLENKMANTWYKFALPKNTDATEYKTKAIHSLRSGGCFCLSGLVQGLSKQMSSSMQALKVPSTLVWGNKDFTHKSTNFDSIKEHLPNCKIIEFDNCGHFPELENTAKYITLINEFTS